MSKESKTIINSKGKILFFGLNHFLADIINGHVCFICGALPDSKPFNDEHVIPDWILRRYGLHAKTINLPNGTKMRYGQYKIPCCQDCNTELGRTYEIPISNLLNKPYEGICLEIEQNPEILKLLFKWVSLLFIKTHLKDKILLAERDTRKGSGSIGDNHYWEEMHHIHCIARSHFSNAIIDPKVFGTICILPAMIIEGHDKFDFVDSEAGKAIMIQINGFCVISVLNDSTAAYSLFQDVINKIPGPLSPFQIREIVAHFNYINLNLKVKPLYKSVIDTNSQYRIIAEIPDYFSLVDKSERISSPGEFLKYYVSEMIGDIDDREKILNEIGEGKRNYLLDEKGIFINHNDC